MEKGKYGVRLCFYTIIAFILAYLGHSTLLFLIAGVVMIAEKNEWATRQVIQAICLCFVNNIVSALLSIFDFIFKIPIIGNMWGVGKGLISGAVAVFVLVFCVVGILKNIKGEDAGIIGAKKIADWACGVIRQNTQA